MEENNQEKIKITKIESMDDPATEILSHYDYETLEEFGNVSSAYQEFQNSLYQTYRDRAICVHDCPEDRLSDFIGWLICENEDVADIKAVVYGEPEIEENEDD